MYRVRSVCLNPACKAVFDVSFHEIGPLWGETAEIASDLAQSLHDNKDLLYRPDEREHGSPVPLYVECPSCRAVFPRDQMTFFAYNADRSCSE